MMIDIRRQAQVRCTQHSQALSLTLARLALSRSQASALSARAKRRPATALANLAAGPNKPNKKKSTETFCSWPRPLHRRTCESSFDFVH